MWDSLTPLDEDEEIQFELVVKAFEPAGLQRVQWHCACKRLCFIYRGSILRGTREGRCMCGRCWNLDIADMTAIRIDSIVKKPIVIGA